MLLDLLHRAFAVRSRSTRAHRDNERAIALWHQGQCAAAARILRELIRQQPGFAPAYGNLGMILAQQYQFDEALTTLEQAAELAPDNAGIQGNLAAILHRGRSFSAAIERYERAIELDPARHESIANLLRAYMDVCDWHKLTGLIERLLALIEQNKADVWTKWLTPVTAQLLPLTNLVRTQLTDAYRHNLAHQTLHPFKYTTNPVAGRRRLRLGYLSPDFREHAVAYQSGRLFGLHDRSRFEVFAYGYGPNTEDSYQQQIAAGSDHFIDIAALSSGEAAQHIVDDKIDILIDLAGHTGDARPEILAHRPAPMQLHYLGYPGSVGTPLVDFLIADAVTIPPESEVFYSETILRLPCSFFICDDQQTIAPLSTTRSDHGLPEHGVVYCCLNIAAKIEPTVFDSWMRILNEVPHSVLWLGPMDGLAKLNLGRHASDRGVAAERIIFADRMSHRPEYLARYQLADLFLDTFLYNAHAIAADALWAGLPLLTLQGSNFAGRVASSLLHGVGLDELITHNTQDYETMAISLAQHPNLLAGITQRLRNNKTSHPLFQTSSFVRHFEEALLHAWASAERGR